MSLEKWLAEAKKDGVINEVENNPSNNPQEEKKVMEVESAGSSPAKKENKIITDDRDFQWVITPRGLKFPLGLDTHIRAKGGRLSSLAEEDRVYNRFGSLYPCVQVWLDSMRSKSTKEQYSLSLRNFCIDNDISPKEFANLWQTIEDQNKARMLATNYILPFIRTKANYAAQTIKGLKSFFRKTTGFILNLDTSRGGALEIKTEDKEPSERPRFNYGTYDEMREHLDRLINIGSRDIQDQVALAILGKAGLRDGTLNHFRVKDVQDIIEVEKPETGEKVELLCLTITGKICEKTKHYNFPKLVDDPEQRRGYYTYLAGDSLMLFKKFMQLYHRNSDQNDLLFKSKEGGKFRDSLRIRYLRRVVLAGYPEGKLRLHDLRAIFDELAHEALKKNRAEMLAGHLLKRVEEAYQKRKKLDCARDYLQIDFKLSEESIIKRWREKLEREEARRLEEEQKALEKVEPIEVPTSIEAPTHEGWQTPQMTEQTLPHKEPSPQRIGPPQLPKETVTMTKSVTVQKVREHMKPTLERVLKPAPKRNCLRSMTFGPNDTDIYCHDVCSQKYPTEYKACQELQQENPELFA